MRIPGNAQAIAALLTVAVALLTLSGCGWQLRGSGMIPEGLKSLYVVSRDPNSNLVRDLSRALESADVEVPDSPEGADYSLIILKEKSLVRVASVNEAARTSEQALIEEVQFIVNDAAGLTVIPEAKVTTERVFEYDENNVLATQDERDLIRTEMRRDIINQMLNHLRQLRNQPDAAAP